MQAWLQDSSLYTDDAALLLQTISEALRLIRKHISLKKLEAQEGTEYQLVWEGETPIVQELRQRPAGRPVHESLHIQAAAEHRRLTEQAPREPYDSSPPASPTQGQAPAWQGRHESHSMLGSHVQRQLGWRAMLRSGIR